jgi:hypothetical protein
MLRGELSAERTAAELVTYLTSSAPVKPPPAIEEHGGQPAAQTAAEAASLRGSKSPKSPNPVQLSGIEAWRQSGAGPTRPFDDGSKRKGDGRSQSDASLGGRSRTSMGSAASSFAGSFRSFASNARSAVGPAWQPVPVDPIEAMQHGLRGLDDDVLEDLDLEGLVRDIGESDELRLACMRHTPSESQDRLGRPMIAPEVALLSYHQMCHDRNVHQAKSSVAQARAAGDSPAYKAAMERLVGLAVLDFRLARMDALVGELVQAGVNARHEVGSSLDRKLPSLMSLDKVRWRARVYVEAKVGGGNFFDLATSHSSPVLQDMKALQNKYLDSKKEVERLQGFGLNSFTDSGLRKERRKRDRLEEKLAKAQAGSGIEVADLDHLVDKVVMADDAAMRAHMLALTVLKDELVLPQAQAMCAGHSASGSDLDVGAGPAQVLDHVLHTSGVAAAKEQDAAKLAAGTSNPALVPTLKLSKYGAWSINDGTMGSKNALKWCFRGDELDSMCARIQTLGASNLFNLMKAVRPPSGVSISEYFHAHMQKLMREVVSTAEKDPAFCKQLRSVWSELHDFALKGNSYNNSDTKEGHRKGYPEVAELAIHRLELMVDAHTIARGDYDKKPEALAKKTLRHFRCAMLVRPWCVGLGIAGRVEHQNARGVQATLPQQYSENFGNLHGLPVLDDALDKTQPHMGAVTTNLLRTWHALSDSLGLGIMQHFEYAPLVDPRPVPIGRKSKTKDAEVQALYEARVQAARDCDAAQEGLDERCIALKAEVLGTSLVTFMDWATRWPPLLAAFGRIQPEAHVLKAAEKSGENDAGIDNMLSAIKARRALGTFLKAQGTLEALGQAGSSYGA